MLGILEILREGDIPWMRLDGIYFDRQQQLLSYLGPYVAL
jgi:hypothetical protein